MKTKVQCSVVDLWLLWTFSTNNSWLNVEDTQEKQACKSEPSRSLLESAVFLGEMWHIYQENRVKKTLPGLRDHGAPVDEPES